MRVAVTGTTGRVGTALATHLAARGHDVIRLSRSAFDLTDSAAIDRQLDALECEAFLNPAGITALEACEDAPDLARQVNVEAPRRIAAWAASRGVRLIHFSTDYVFDGERPGLRTEEEAPAPLSVYGSTKFAGENAVLDHGGLVMRVSWVFGPEKPSFIDTVVARALAGEPLEAVADKFSLPTFTGDLAGWTERLMEGDETGIFHACQSGEPVSWHGMAEAVVDELTIAGRLARTPQIRPLKLAEVAAFRAPRPRHTAMDNGRLARVLGHSPRPWEQVVRVYVRETR